MQVYFQFDYDNENNKNKENVTKKSEIIVKSLKSCHRLENVQSAWQNHDFNEIFKGCFIAKLLMLCFPPWAC